MFRCSRAASALSFSILIVDSRSSNSSFLSSIPNCMIWYFSWDNSVKSDEELFGDDCGFFLRIGTSSVVHLILGVSTATGLLSTPLSLTSQSITSQSISNGLVEDMMDSGVVLSLSLITSANS